jgi:excisionase family DNA binding protein
MITLDTSNYLTLKESAKFLGVSLMTIRRWVDDKKLKVFKLSPRKLFIKESDLKEILK